VGRFCLVISLVLTYWFPFDGAKYNTSRIIIESIEIMPKIGRFSIFIAEAHIPGLEGHGIVSTIHQIRQLFCP
jgi:hypothetical protein